MRLPVHHITTYLLAALLFAKMFSMPLVYLDFQLNKQFIAEKLCENKARPVLQCNGKCQLKKKMVQANDAPESNTEKITVKSVSIEMIQELPSFTCNLLFDSVKIIKNLTTASKLSAGSSASIFHPPIA